MKTKQYLRRAFRLDQAIQTDRLELERLRELALSVPSGTSVAGVAGTNALCDRVSGIVAKIVDLETKIQGEIDRYVDLKREIRERIEAVENEEYRLILLKRYINFEKWDDIAADFGYSFRNAMYLHGSALRSFESLHTISH